jgi:diacylglycerol kinase-like protein
MSPPGPKGISGVGFPPPLGPEAEPIRAITPVPAAERPATSPLRNSLASLFARYRRNLNGKTILVVFNPAARDGKIARDLPQLVKVLERSGAKVLLVQTVPNIQERRELIRQSTQAALEQGDPIYVLPYGGDGIIGEAVGEALKAIGVDLASGRQGSQANAAVAAGLESFVIAKKGKAADIAVELGAPESITRLPASIRRGVKVPFRFPIIDGSGVGIHSFVLGVSAHLFALRESNKAANPTKWYNQGLWSYLRLVPSVVPSRYGLFGVDFELTRSTLQGEELEKTTVRGADLQITPRRIIAGVGGIPGTWGETKVVVLPPFLPGVLAVTEYASRGLLTKYLGLNLVGPRSRLRTLSPQRQWIIGPQEKISVKVRVPNTPAWWALRGYQEFLIDSGEALPATRIPPAGELLAIPSILNGDVSGPKSQFTVTAPPLTVNLLGHPNSLAVRLARASALVHGESPLLSDQQLVASTVPRHRPAILKDSPETVRIRTPFVSQPRLRDLMRRHHLSFERDLQLLTAMQSAVDPSQLKNLASEELTVERMELFLKSEQGQEWCKQNTDSLKALGKRALTGGVPLVAGMATLWGSGALADTLGLDPIRQRELRFGLTVYLSHAAQVNLAPLWEVMVNRMLHRPYDYVRIRDAEVAGETLQQWTLESHNSVGRALSSAWRSGSIGWEVGGAGLWRRGLGLGLVPFRAAWNMGEGLLFSRLAETVVRGLPEDSRLKQYAPSAAFFAPDVARILSPRLAFPLLEARALRLASRAFAVGFIGDMAFTGIHRMAHGERATYEQWVDFRTAERRRESGEIGPLSWRQIPRFFAPSLSAYIDSHEYLFGEENEMRQKIYREDLQQSALLQNSIRQQLVALPAILQKSAKEIFSSPVQLSIVEREMLEQLQASRGKGLLPSDANFKQTVSYLHRQFRALVKDREEVTRHLAWIQVSQVQQGISYLRNIDISENHELSRLFDEQGRLLPHQEEELEKWIWPSTESRLALLSPRSSFLFAKSKQFT